MHFEIDPHLAASPSSQIVEQVRFAIASGRLEPGDRLPSVRSAAASARVNPNTISKAYGELKAEGDVALRRGEGVYVTEAAPKRCCADARREIEQRATRLVRDALAAGVDLDALARIVEAASKDAHGEKRKSA